MDGLLVIDKPAGPTSHDVVARIRRALRERRIGHTGTLDPSASGVLPLVIGRATRLAQFMSGADKAYDAVLRLGVSTDTADAAGEPIGAVHTGPWPSRDAIDRALDAFRGSFVQQPPAFSAKKVQGKRSHRLARAARRDSESRDTESGDSESRGAQLPQPVTVTAHAIDVLAVDGDTVSLRVHCSSGFYVRTLAQDLGDRLGTGGHLTSLRRTRCGEFTLADAVALADAERDGAAAAARVVPVAALLTHLGAVVLTADGLRYVIHGRELTPACLASRFSRSPADAVGDPETALVRLVSATGELIGIARPGSAPDLLHPFVVLV